MLYRNLAVRLGLEPMVYAAGKGLESPLPWPTDVHELTVLLETPWNRIVPVWVESKHDHWSGPEAMEDAHEPLVVARGVIALVLVLIELYHDRMRAHIKHEVRAVQVTIDPLIVNDRLVWVPRLKVLLQLRFTSLEHTWSIWKEVRCASSAIFFGMNPTQRSFTSRVLYVNHSIEFMVCAIKSLLFRRQIEYRDF